MAVVEYRKVKCDNCRKEKIVESSGAYPINWIIISLYEWAGSAGFERFKKDVCNDKCALKLLNNLRKIPKIRPNRLRIS